MPLREVAMPSISVITNQGQRVALEGQEVAELKSALGDRLLTPSSTGYDEARSIWNAMIDRRPAVIARCESAAEVAQAVRVAATNNLLVSIKGGGHNIAGNAVCRDGLMIDLSLMKRVVVDTSGRTARVQPGCTLAELDAATQAHGLAVPLGINSTTGVAGLTLGGGFGWLTRKYGFTVDSLISAEIVTADGATRLATASENEDLFWAIRGGGGNFGIVTEFTFMLHPVGPEVLAGLIVHPFEDIQALTKHYRSFVAGAPEELTTWLVFRKAPPLPFVPAEWHGREVVVIAFLYAGDVAHGDRVIAPLRRFGRPVGEHVGPMPYAAYQQAFDPLLTPGARNYWKSHDFRQISDAAFEVIQQSVSNLPSPHCEIFLAHLGGAGAGVAPDAMAFSRRDAEFIVNVHTRWESAADDAKCVGWAREFFTAMAPHAMGSVYVNFMPEDEVDRLPAAWGPNYPRLAAIKAKYDPKNLFRVNQNIQPAAV
jgi:FAD/FMN-containing dehydrogenase